MSLVKRIAISLLAILLVASLVGANVAMTAERTALSATYVTTTLEEENAYADATDVIEQSITDRVDAETDRALDRVPDQINTSELTAEALVDASLTESYVKTQINENVEGIYAFLHGDEAELTLAVELAPVKSNVAQAVSDRVVDVDVAGFSELAIDNLETDVPIDSSVVAKLLANESSYQQAQADFQQSIPAPVSLETVNQRLKADMETATRTALGDADQQITDAVIQMQFATADALTTDMTYQEYQQAIDDSKHRIADRVEQLVRDRLNEDVPDTLSLSEQLDEPTRDRLDTVQRGVGLVDRLTWLLPAFALVVLALVYLVARSLWSVGQTAGWAALIAGISGLLPAVLARDPVTTFLRTTISGEGSEQFADVAVALVGGILTTLRNQSLLLVLAGIVTLALVYADRGGHFDGVRRRLGFGPAPRGATVSSESAQD